MDFLQAVVLGVLQGLTEFLPISSSAHLRVYPEWFGWGDPGAAFTAVVQIGTELAVLLYFRQDIWNIGSTWVLALFRPALRTTLEARLGWFIIVGSVPIVVVGIALQDLIEGEFRNLWITGTVLIVLGLVLGLAERVGRGTREIAALTWRDAVLLGAAQAAAVVPGVSRSGATISMGLFLGYERAAATRYAFLLAIPAVVGAGLFQLPEIPGGENVYGVAPTAAATVVSFVIGYVTIAWLLRYVSTHSYTPFVIYRVLFGSLTLALVGTGILNAT